MNVRSLGRLVLVFIIVASIVFIGLSAKKVSEFNSARKDYMQNEYPKREQLFGDMLSSFNKCSLKKYTMDEASIIDHLGRPDFLRDISGERELVYLYIHYDREYMSFINFSEGKLKRIHKGTRFSLPEEFKPYSINFPNQHMDFTAANDV